MADFRPDVSVEFALDKQKKELERQLARITGSGRRVQQPARQGAAGAGQGAAGAGQSREERLFGNAQQQFQQIAGGPGADGVRSEAVGFARQLQEEALSLALDRARKLRADESVTNPRNISLSAFGRGGFRPAEDKAGEEGRRVSLALQALNNAESAPAPNQKITGFTRSSKNREARQEQAQVKAIEAGKASIVAAGAERNKDGSVARPFEFDLASKPGALDEFVKNQLSRIEEERERSRLRARRKTLGGF